MPWKLKYFRDLDTGRSPPGTGSTVSRVVSRSRDWPRGNPAPPVVRRTLATLSGSSAIRTYNSADHF